MIGLILVLKQTSGYVYCFCNMTSDAKGDAHANIFSRLTEEEKKAKISAYMAQYKREITAVEMTQERLQEEMMRVRNLVISINNIDDLCIIHEIFFRSMNGIRSELK